MTESSANPENRTDVPDDWERAARLLLIQQLELQNDLVSDAVRGAALQLEQDGMLEPGKLSSLRTQTRQLQLLTEFAAYLTPDMEPIRDPVTGENLKREPADGGATTR
jgi:hypothetical protein